jgi:DNA-binding NarL/FixJ family response regulator
MTESGWSHPRVAVVAEESLVAEALRAALTTHGFAPCAVATAPGVEQMDATSETRSPQAGLLISGLESYHSIRAAQRVVAQIDVPWAVVTSAPRGPGWGALFQAGAAVVVGSAVSIVEVVSVLGSLVHGTRVGDPELERALRGRWQDFERERAAVAARLAALTPWELTILRSLYDGHAVPEIATRHHVSQTTVHDQVQVLLVKLDLGSQLAAVHQLELLLAFDAFDAFDPETEPPL